MSKHMVKGEKLYRKKPNGRYEPVLYAVDEMYRFPQGRWVLVVDGSRSCCVSPVKNVDNAITASLQLFRWVLEEEIIKSSKPSIGGDLTKQELEAITKIVGNKLVWFTSQSAGSVALAAVTNFAKIVFTEKEDQTTKGNHV